jgi:hypothetical protein
MDYIVCIPSYKRAKICNNRTLNTLRCIDPSKIYVYVADEAEYEVYKSILDPTLYNELRIGVKGLVEQRQLITEQWPLHQHIVCLDDDIESIDLSLTQFTSLEEFIQHAFSECIKQKSYIWGVYAVHNPFFRKARAEVVTGLNFIIGAFYGIINRPTCNAIKLEVSKIIGIKEDVERTLKYFLLDGIVLRFNKIGFKTKYYGKEGGLGNFKDRLEPAREISKLLKEAYPEYGNIRTRKNGMTEFVFKRSAPSKKD